MGDPNAPPLDSESLLGLLDRHRVSYVLVGGLVAVAHGAMRATFDIDIVPRWKPDNLDALAGALRAADARLRVPDVAEPIEVPLDGGCHTITLKRDDLLDHDGRFEYWDGDTETAWVVSEPTSATHEQPSQRLAGLGQIVAGVRGSPIECYGTMDLLLRNEHGEKWRIMQADQSLYLHPARARLPVDAMEIGEHDYPDVVLEVDHTTDVRRGKLGLYEAWGFPEIWVDTPESGYAVKRPAGVSSGMTIYLLEGGVYRTAGQSRAFPGWTAVELHTAFNEEMLSPETSRVLRRVGRALGVREGTGPDDTPWLRMERHESRVEGYAEGRTEGHAAGRAEGRAAGRAEGEKALLVRLATRRFDAGTAERLAALLARIDDPARLAGIGDRIVECATGAELLARVEAPGSRG